MNKLIIAAVLSLAALQPAFADSIRPQGVMNQTAVYESTPKFFLHPARLEWSDASPAQMDERLTADDEDSLVTRLRWHNQALAALGLKLGAETFGTFPGETLWMNQNCTPPSYLDESQSAHVGTVRSATSFDR
ncbi:MAG: hypothetical protein ACREV9_17635 [Burkholderiales bacterium]